MWTCFYAGLTKVKVVVQNDILISFDDHTCICIWAFDNQSIVCYSGLYLCLFTNYPFIKFCSHTCTLVEIG